MSNETPQIQSRAMRRPVRAFTLAALIAATTVPLAASAATGQKITANAHGERISITVPMDVLAADDGVSRIYRALERKAERSCKTTIPQSLGHAVPVTSCTRDLLDGFVEELNHEELTALHNAES